VNRSVAAMTWLFWNARAACALSLRTSHASPLCARQSNRSMRALIMHTAARQDHDHEGACSYKLHAKTNPIVSIQAGQHSTAAMNGPGLACGACGAGAPRGGRCSGR